MKDFISGPELNTPIPDCSVAEFFIPKIRAHPKGNILQVDAVTGYAETSRQVLEKSLKVAEGLRKLGLGQDDVFCLISWNSSDVYASVLGVWWLGGVLAPLDPEWKVLELAPMFEKLKPTVVICEPRVLDKVTAALKDIGRDARIIVFTPKNEVKDHHVAFEDLLQHDVDVDNDRPEPVRSPSSQIALVIATGGSTGLPKGVGLTHRNVIYQALAMLQRNVEYSCKSALVTSHFYWISCILSLVPSLCTGMKKIYMREITPRNKLNAIKKYRPEWCFIGPGSLMHLLKQPDIDQYDLSCFKLITMGGSVVTQTVLDCAKKIGGFSLANGYGASEVMTFISITDPDVNLLSVGKILAGVKVKIVDPDTKKTLGPNEEGEILISSPGMMKGYVGLEEETKAVVVDGWYHSGDLGYYDELGNLYVVDRLKEMIKDAGNHHITPCEVEGVIESLPGVLEAGVVGLLKDADDFQLVGLVVKMNGAKITEEDVKNVVKEKLSKYKQLKVVKFVNGIPRSNTGKISRRGLKELAVSLCS